MHRLVRISPFDSQSRRHTSVCLGIWVYPVVDDTHRGRDPGRERIAHGSIPTAPPGAGGQHVNKTDSAIRITHLPTNIVVQCQNDRSQHKQPGDRHGHAQGPALRARAAEAARPRPRPRPTAKTDIGWGHQIRSYVLQPYQMVKDLRTGVEKGNAQGVLDGDIGDFLSAALAARIGAERSREEGPPAG